MIELFVFLNLKESNTHLFNVITEYKLVNGRLPDTRLQGSCVFIIDSLGNIIKRPSSNVFPAIERLNSRQLSALRKQATEINYKDLSGMLNSVYVPRTSLLDVEDYRLFIDQCLNS